MLFASNGARRLAARVLVSVLAGCGWIGCRQVVAAFSLSKEQDEVSQHLGYVPSNFVSIVARTANKEPLVIQTYPLKEEKESTNDIGRPFPTLYWLCHKQVGRAIADMERRGFMNDIYEQLLADDEKCMRWLECHKQYAEQRWMTLDPKVQSWIMEEADKDSGSWANNIRQILQDSGIAGSNITTSTTSSSSVLPSIKCLHAHYAHYRADSHSIINPVGQLTHELLKKEFPCLIL